MVTITGNTYPVKDKLKALGAKWNPEAKGWDISDDLADKAREIVANAAKKSYSPKICKVCGCKEYRDPRGYVKNKIYRSGECRDCYEERKMGY